MPTPYADSAAHNAIPEEFLWCIMTLRHHFPPPGREEKVRIPYEDGSGGSLDVFESITECALCGTVRTLWRDQQDESYVQGVYAYPEGYRPPPGTVWDRAYLRQVYRRRHPVKGKTRVVTR